VDKDDRRIEFVRLSGEKIVLDEATSDRFRGMLDARHPGWSRLPHMEQEKLMNALLLELMRDLDKLPVAEAKRRVEQFILEKMANLPPREPGQR
jgi:hypothetical protein